MKCRLLRAKMSLGHLRERPRHDFEGFRVPLAGKWPFRNWGRTILETSEAFKFRKARAASSDRKTMSRKMEAHYIWPHLHAIGARRGGWGDKSMPGGPKRTEVRMVPKMDPGGLLKRVRKTVGN